MRVRLPFVGAFVLLLLISGYLGLSSLQLGHIINDKVLHVLTFFVLTTVFYWILDTTRRRNLNLSLLVCTALLGVGSEFLQSALPNGRDFHLYDILANVVGSLAALALSSWYHKRMLERKRQAKQYQVVPGAEDQDLELGEGIGPQESGIVDPETAPATRSLEDEVDHWDENAPDEWEEEQEAAGTDSAEGEGPKTPSASSAGDGDAQPPPKKRVE